MKYDQNQRTPPLILRRHFLGGLIGASIAAPLVAHAQPIATGPVPVQRVKPVAIVGATVITGSAPPIKNATVVLRGHTIASVTTGAVPPPDASVVQANGRIVTAGFVDLLSQVGLSEVSLEPSANDGDLKLDDPINAALRTVDSFDSASTLLPIARTGGITGLGVIPDEGLITGLSCLAGADGVITQPALMQHVRIDDWAYGRYEPGRADAWLRLREAFDDAQSYRTNAKAYGDRRLRHLRESRLDLEALKAALDGRVPIVFHVDRASDIRRALAMSETLGFKLALASAAEGWKVARAIAKANVPVIVYPLAEGPYTFAARHARPNNAAKLHAAGVSVSLASGESHNVRKLRQAAGNAVRAGLPHAAAIAGLTENPATLAALTSTQAKKGVPSKRRGKLGKPSPTRDGRIAAGSVADVVLWSGDPLELSTSVEAMWISGKRQSLATRQTALFERYRTQPGAPPDPWKSP